MDENHTTLELYIINAVKKRRLELGINPSKLSKEIGLSRGFIRLVEKLEYGNSYTYHQLNEIAKVLKCKITDFFPVPYLEEDCIEEYQIVHPPKRSKKY